MPSWFWPTIGSLALGAAILWCIKFMRTPQGRLYVKDLYQAYGTLPLIATHRDEEEGWAELTFQDGDTTLTYQYFAADEGHETIVFKRKGFIGFVATYVGATLYAFQYEDDPCQQPVPTKASCVYEKLRVVLDHLRFHVRPREVLG